MPNNSKPKAAPANPNNDNAAEELPHDAVRIHVWRNFTGAQPLSLIVSKESWEKNRKAVKDGMFHLERIYEFESPINSDGWKSVFQLQDVIGWAAIVHTGIVPPPPGLQV